MTTPDNAQPEALRLAEWLSRGGWPSYVPQEAAAKLLRLHAEMQQLKAQNANLRDALTDIASGEITRSHCVGPHCTEELGVATADELSSRAAGALNWDDLVAKQFPDVGIPISAQLSARQAAPDGWRLVPELPTLNMLNTAFGICTENGRTVQQMVEAATGKYAAMLAASPTPPDRKNCWCETCRPINLRDMRFVVCPDCGNKRCPKANNHDNACTNSNAPGQPGSSWEHVKPRGIQGEGNE